MSAAHRIVLGDDPATWSALGFRVRDGACRLGPLELAFTGEGGGVIAVEVAALAAPLEELPLRTGPLPRDDAPAQHPNGALAVDHLVVLTPDRDATVAALERAGADLRRTGEPPALPARMAFLRFGSLIVEVAEHPDPESAFFWGLTVAVADLHAVEAIAGDRLGAIRPALQPGRRIATARPSAESGLALAFMDGERRFRT